MSRALVDAHQKKRHIEGIEAGDKLTQDAGARWWRRWFPMLGTVAPGGQFPYRQGWILIMRCRAMRASTGLVTCQSPLLIHGALLTFVLILQICSQKQKQ